MPLVKTGVGVFIGITSATCVLQYCPRVDNNHLHYIFGTGLFLSSLYALRYSPETITNGLKNGLKIGLTTTMFASMPIILYK